MATFGKTGDRRFGKRAAKVYMIGLEPDFRIKAALAEVTIYTRQFCGYCTAAKALLADKGIPFTEIDAGRDPEKRNEMMQRSGRFTYPQIFVGARHVGGYTDIHALNASGELDSLLAVGASA